MNLNEIMTKWGSDKSAEGHNYTPNYEFYFEKLKNQNLTILELGVGGEDVPNYGGLSLLGWKEYFQNSKIYGVDIYDKKFVDTDRIKTYQGSQADASFLDIVLKESGTPNIIIDDASHISELTIKSFQILFPKLVSGGYYVIEDLECSYRWDFGGFVELTTMNQPTIMNYLLKMVHHLNDINIADNNYQRPELFKQIEFIHFYRGIAFIKKK